MTEFRLQHTRIVESNPTHATVEIVISDHHDLAAATEFLSLRTRIEYAANPLLADVQARALQRVRDVLGAQIQAATSRAGQSHDR